MLSLFFLNTLKESPSSFLGVFQWGTNHIPKVASHDVGKPIHILLFLDIFTFHVFSELMTQNSDISSENGNGYLFDQFEK